MNPQQQQQAYAQYGQANAVAYSTYPFGQQGQGPYGSGLPYPVPGQQQSQQPYYPHTTTPQQRQQQQSIPGARQSQSQYPAPPAASTSTRQDDHEAAGALASPDNGPGAPLPGPESPSMLQYDDEVRDALDGQDQDNDQPQDEDDHDDDDENAQRDDSGQPVFHLPPPPEATYPTYQDLEEAIHSWSKEHGYELVRRASKKNAKGVLYKRYYHCSKHGKVANTGKLTVETRIRHNRKSQRMNCPMSLAVVATDPAAPQGEWQVRHRKTHHNHGPMDALSLAGHRRRARQGGVEQAVDGLFAIGTPTAQVLQFLQRTNPNGLFTRTDVANMKLKYKKFGTCLERKEPTIIGPGQRSCNQCKAKKMRCDATRPTCSTCVGLNLECVYNYEGDRSVQRLISLDTEQQSEILNAHPHIQGVPQEDLVQTTPIRHRPNGVSVFQQNAQRAEEILANLQAFQTQHITVAKLDLQSSSVEVLAASSCGSGDSYKIVPTLQSPADWPAYRDAMSEATMKENTYEVLLAAKIEPAAPPADCPVEQWNEYIKQLAIFNRRNTALTGALWGTLSPAFRRMVQHLKLASEIWAVLEESCLPRGSDQGYKAYLELHSVSHANSRDLKDYIIRLETAFISFNRLSHTWRAAESHVPPRGTPTATSTGNTINASNPFTALGSKHPGSMLPPAAPVFSEDMLCFLFMKNLGPEFKRWSESLCATNNVAGFGTGPRLGYVDLTKRAAEWEIQQRRG
ncbi:hypothetical protein LTR95_007444 [Oleoguttula sp. CCFEE 5521]